MNNFLLIYSSKIMSKERLLSLLLSLFHISYAQPTLIQVHRKSKQINKYIKVFGFHLIDLKRRKKSQERKHKFSLSFWSRHNMRNLFHVKKLNDYERYNVACRFILNQCAICVWIKFTLCLRASSWKHIGVFQCS